MVFFSLVHAGPDFKTLVTPLVKHVRLHLMDPQDIMKVCLLVLIHDDSVIVQAECDNY